MKPLTPRIVILPEALGELILDPTAHPVLHAWRDGLLQPVVCRTLLLRYLRLLNRLALPPRTVRWWGWWLGSPKKVLITADPDPLPPLAELSQALASSAQAIGTLHQTNHPPSLDFPPNSPWLTPQELLHRLTAPTER